MEIWKDVIGQEGRYSISNYGNVKSHDRESIKTYRGVITGTVKVKGRNLKKMLNMSGYYCVEVAYKSVTIHRLVALAFIPNPSNKPCVNHIDGNKLNNHVDNLEWCTHKENSIHASINNLYNPRLGELNSQAKLTEVEVLEIRSSEESCKELGIKYNVDKTLIWLIKRNKIWKHI